jgi:dephospho-CoA kinase
LRSQLSEDLIRSIIDSQVPRAQQLEMADDIIQNNGSESGLKDNVARLYEIYLRMKKSS